jgi:hypothetical protein
LCEYNPEHPDAGETAEYATFAQHSRFNMTASIIAEDGLW